MHGNPAFRGGFSGNATCHGGSNDKTACRGGSSAKAACGGGCRGYKRDGARCWGRICPILRFIVCLNPTMSKIHKVIVLWVWIVLLTLLIGFPIRFSTYGPEKISSSPGDMRHIQNRFNSFMCTGLEITNKESETVNVYTTPDMPSIDKNEILEQTVQTASSIYDRRFEYWGYHLIAGSEVTITTTVNANVEFYMAKGISRRKMWQNRFKNCQDNCNQLQKRADFTAMYITGTYKENFMISASDDYFFIYARSRLSEQTGINFANINITIFLKRTRYDLSNTKKECVLSTKADQSSCTIDLPYRANLNILLSYKVPSSAKKIDVITTCIPRVWVYLVFFLGLPIAIGLILSALIMLLCKNREKALEGSAVITPYEKTTEI